MQYTQLASINIVFKLMLQGFNLPFTKIIKASILIRNNGMNPIKVEMEKEYAITYSIIRLRGYMLWEPVTTKLFFRLLFGKQNCCNGILCFHTMHILEYKFAVPFFKIRLWHIDI